jgi:hypothetical protein
MLVHVAIVSEQLLLTVILCLMDRPGRVVLVASCAMAERARRLQVLLQTEGLAAEIREQAPDTGLGAIRAYATALAHNLAAEQSGAELVLNATGGTKLMTLAFVEAFRDYAARIIYTDTAHARIEVLYERGNLHPQSDPMPDVLDVPRYLVVQGFRYQQDAVQDATRLARMERRREVARYLAREAAGLSGLIGLINGLAQAALDGRGNELANPVQHLKEEPHGEWRKAFERFAGAGLLQPAGRLAVRFADAEAARFLGGGWLEEYAYAVAREAGLYDVRLGVTGVWDGAVWARNEFDVLACHRNRLLFIECKTLRLKEGQNDNELAYKVKSLGEDVRGLFGATWVLAAQEPTPVLRDRAKQAGFLVIGPKFLGSLPRWLGLWKEGRSAA